MSTTKKKTAVVEPKAPSAVFPKWFTDELRTSLKAGIAHAFILHGNIRDLVPNPRVEDEPEEPYIPFQKFLVKVLTGRDMVMFYNIASGLWFLRPEMEKEFRRLAGIEAEDGGSGTGAPGANPVAAAKAGLAAKRAIPREPDQCLALVEKVLRKSENAALVIDSVHAIAAASGGGIAPTPIERTNIVRLKNWGGSVTMRDNKSVILMLTEQAADVSKELRQSGGSIQTVFLPKPDKSERETYIRSLTTSGVGEEPPFAVPKGFDVASFAHAAQGLNLRQVLEVFLRARQTGEPVSLEYVKNKKREILNAEYGDLLELVEAKRGLEDIGGLEHVKEHFRDTLDAMRRGADSLVPMGETLMGPPGTGKTALVEALAKEAGFNFVKIKNVRSMWVGESEARMERLIYALRSLAPVVVMNDEADLANADRNAPKGDSGVAERLMKAWMELLSDPRIRGRIVVISCTNRPDRLDPALKRSGRSDQRILIPMPSVDEMPAIYKVMFKRHEIPTSITDFTTYAEMTDGLSGADIENISASAYRFAFKRGLKKVDDATLREAIKDFIPSASQSEIDRMTLMGVLESSSRSLLPPNLKSIVAGIKKRNLVEGLAETLKLIRDRNIVEID
jgi:SpoVK/Ycf46/Vps4 family AAA+-type ATPase